MRPFANEPNRQLAAVTPLIGLAGTLVGILFSFDRMGTGPLWRTTLEAVGLGLGETGIGVLCLLLVHYLRLRRM